MVGGISIDQLTQVKRYGEGAMHLIAAVKNKSFSLDIEFAKQLHTLVGKEEALEWGVLRSKQVHVHGVSHIPPAAHELFALAEKGFAFLRERLENPIERAIATFLFISRSQFFFDCNKRTPSLIMNGVLLSEGFYTITVLRETTEEFNEKLKAFYDSGDGAEMPRCFASTSSKLYAS